MPARTRAPLYSLRPYGRSIASSAQRRTGDMALPTRQWSIQTGSSRKLPSGLPRVGISRISGSNCSWKIEWSRLSSSIGRSCSSTRMSQSEYSSMSTTYIVVPVAAGRVAGSPLPQEGGPPRVHPVECSRDAGEDVTIGEPVALNAEVLSFERTGPVEAVGPGEAGGRAEAIYHRELASLNAGVLPQETILHLALRLQPEDNAAHRCRYRD